MGGLILRSWIWPPTLRYTAPNSYEITRVDFHLFVIYGLRVHCVMPHRMPADTPIRPSQGKTPTLSTFRSDQDNSIVS